MIVVTAHPAGRPLPVGLALHSYLAGVRLGGSTAGRLLLPWSVLRGGGSPTYSDYRFIKIHIPKSGSKFGHDKFRTDSGYMCFLNHITTVRG